MLRKLLILALLVFCSTISFGQSITLPDSIFSIPSSEQDVIYGDDIPDIVIPFDKPQFLEQDVSPFDNSMIDLVYSPQFFNYLPDAVSEHLVHVLLLHLSKIDIPGLEEHMLWYNTMLDNFSRNLYSGGGFTFPYNSPIFSDTHSSTFITAGGGFVVYNGCLDPVEAYRRWLQQKRLKRAGEVIRTIEEMPTRATTTQGMPAISLPDNLLNETNYDVKVKLDGDNPPYRPYGQ